MGKKSRIKKEGRQQGFEKQVTHPVKLGIQTFLAKRRVATDEASGLSYCVSRIVEFLIYRFIKDQTQVPAVRSEEKADKNRIEQLRTRLELECRKINIEPQEIMDELVNPMAENETLIKPILEKIYGIIESLIPSKSFREATESQIEDPESWGDSLLYYADRKEDYFEAVKRLCALDLAIVRSSLAGHVDEIDHDQRLEAIRTEFGIEPDDFQKLRRRATEFFRVAFANYLEMDFQPIRDQVDDAEALAALSAVSAPK